MWEAYLEPNPAIRGSQISSYQIELRNWVIKNDITLEVLTRFFPKKSFLELLTQKWKIKSFTLSYKLEVDK